MFPRPMNPMSADLRKPLLIREVQFQRADGLEMPADDVGRDVLELVRPPFRIAVLVDNGRANALDEVVAGDCGKCDPNVPAESFPPSA